MARSMKRNASRIGLLLIAIMTLIAGSPASAAQPAAQMR
jgi:hypothetical protein